MTDQNAAENEVAKPISDSLITDEPKLDFTTKPEGFPDGYWDADSNTVNVEQLYKGYTNEKARAEGLRVKLSKGEFTGVAPKDAAEYTLELADELKPMVPEDDPMLGAARNAALEAGMTKEQFGKFMPTVVKALADLKAQADAPPTEEQIAEQNAQIAATRQAEIEKLGPSGNKIVAALDEFRKGLLADGTLSDEEGEAMKMMVFDATTARIMNKLRSRRGEPDNVPVMVPVDDKSSKSDIESKMAKAFQSGNEEEFKKYSAMLSKYA